MDAKDIVVASAIVAAQTVQTDRFATMAKYALGLTGTVIARHVRAGENPGLFAPLDVVLAGHDRPGAILALTDRAILGWTVGTLRMKHFAVVVPYASITGIEETTRAGSVLRLDREGLLIRGDGAWEVVFANLFEGGRSIRPFLVGVMERSIKFRFDGDDADEPQSAPPQAAEALLLLLS